MGTAFLYGNGGTGGTGATLTVTAPAGATVTVSKDGKTKTKTAGADGLAVFNGLATGEWTVTITDGTQTASKVVSVTADYATSITFFTATINVTYPAGSTCTVTDGVTTLTAPDTSGTWACVVPKAGTWTARESAKGFSDSVSINSSGDYAELDVTKLWLYKNGDLRTDNTGGWNATGWTGDYPLTAGVLASDRINMYGTVGKETILATDHKVDFSGLTTLFVDLNLMSNQNNNEYAISINSAKGHYINTRYGYVKTISIGAQKLSLPINGKDSAYIIMSVGGNVNLKVDVFRIWAE